LYQLTDSPLLLGLLGLFQALPIFVLVPLAGTIADRVPQRPLVIAVQIVSLVNSLALGLLVTTGRAEPWHLYLQAFVQSALSAFDVTARQAFFPRLVPRTEIDAAVTLNFSVARVVMLTGPAIGGVMLAAWDAATPFLFNAATYLLMCAAMLLIRGPVRALPAARRGSVRADLFGGLQFVRRSPVIFPLLLYAASWGLLSHNPSLLTIFAGDVLHAGPEGLGLLLSAVAAGQLLGSVALVGVGEIRQKGTALFVAGTLYTLVMLAFAFSRAFWLSAALLFLAGIPYAVLSALCHTILHRSVPDTLRGRVLGTYLLITRGLNPLSQTLSGALVGGLGPTAAILCLMGGLGVATAAFALRSPSLRRFTTTDAAAEGPS
jgi:MFS family permease